jgi:hypothetical protein
MSTRDNRFTPAAHRSGFEARQARANQKADFRDAMLALQSGGTEVPAICQALRPLRRPYGPWLPLFQYSERNYFCRRRIFRDICLRRLLQEQFAFTNHNRWPPFLS